MGLSGLASTGSDAVGGFSGESVPAFGVTLRPLRTPRLWFYRCNNCDKIGLLGKLVLDYHPHWFGRRGRLAMERMEMLLCNNCLREYNDWNRRWLGCGDVRRGKIRDGKTLYADTGESGEAYDVELSTKTQASS